MRQVWANHKQEFHAVIWTCVLTAILWTGTAAAEAMMDESHEPTHTAATSYPPNYQPVDDAAYSMFMHHSSGLTLIVIGMLVLTDRLTNRRYGAVRLAIGLTWIVFGAHVFIRSDPDAWPLGPPGFLESFSIPIANEWIQHKLFSLIPFILGTWTLLSKPGIMNGRWSYTLGGILALGGAGLLIHRHPEHPTMDTVNLQHLFMALMVMGITGFLIADGQRTFTWKVKPFLFPLGLIVLGLQLMLYVE
jgi:putative copper resistance protein D